jgi:hypothetical protein
VVDPAMEGQVKITVIATGFDRNWTQTAAASKVTPVDLSAYTVRTIQTEERVAASGGSHSLFSRRPPLDLPVAAQAEVNGNAADPSDGDDDSSPLDVPAFLRRQEG